MVSSITDAASVASAGGPNAGSAAHGRKKASSSAAPAPAAGRADGAHSNPRFAEFRVRWEAKHGAAAAKEMKLDAAAPPEGASWTSAQPAPFKVLHLAGGAPVYMGPPGGS